MTKFVSDDELAIEVTGLRWIKKSDAHFPNGRDPGPHYQLEWEYKGAHGFHKYKDQLKRDALFELIREAMKPRLVG